MSARVFIFRKRATERCHAKFLSNSREYTIHRYAPMAINANVARVYYRDAYRDAAGLDVLRQGGVEVIHYDQWRDLWR